MLTVSFRSQHSCSFPNGVIVPGLSASQLGKLIAFEIICLQNDDTLLSAMLVLYRIIPCRIIYIKLWKPEEQSPKDLENKLNKSLFRRRPQRRMVLVWYWRIIETPILRDSRDKLTLTKTHITTFIIYRFVSKRSLKPIQVSYYTFCITNVSY